MEQNKEQEASKRKIRDQSRAKKIQEMMAENEKILGKRVMSRTKKEAEEIAISLQDEFFSQMTEEEIETVINDFETRCRKHRKTYAEKRNMEDAKFMEEHANCPEILESYRLARKITNSAKTAREMVANNTAEEVMEKYKAFRAEENRKKAISNKKKAKNSKKSKSAKAPTR